jgi:hypothetical protein
MSDYVTPSEFEIQIAKDRREQEKKHLFECPHKEILLAECILEDESGLRYHLCSKCFKRYSILKGFKVIQQQGDSNISQRKYMDRKQNGRLPF